MFIEPRTSQRPLLWIGGGSQLADPKSPDVPKFVKSVKARTLRADGWIPRPDLPAAGHRPRLGASSRPYYPRGTARTRARLLVAHENFLHLVLTNDPAKAREEQHRAFLKVMSAERGPAVPRVGLPVRDAGRDHRLAPGAGRRRRRVLLPAHDDARPGPAPALGRRDHPERRLPGDRRSGPPAEPRPGRRRVVTRRVALIGKPLKRRHSQVMHDAAFEAAGIDARYVLLELEPRRGRGRGRARRAGRTGSASA